MLTKTRILITGATGYIGGSVLERLLRHPNSSHSEITALVRNATKVPLFESIGVKAVVGSHEDDALLERLASESDIIFTCADGDNVAACETILRGLKKRHETTGIAPVLIHTSGTGVLIDNARGMYVSDVVWDDTDSDGLEMLPDTQPHRETDLLVIAADKQGYARTYIVLPSTIYGFAAGKLVDLGIQKPRSDLITRFTAVCAPRKRAGMVGLGLNMWPNVHIDDVGDLYMVLYDAILDGRASHGRDGLYFAENGEHALKEVYKRIGDAFVELGVSGPGEQTPTAFDEVEYAKPGNGWLQVYLGGNSRCRAKRGRALGWKPRYTTEDMLHPEGIRGGVEWQLRRMAGA